MNPEMENRRLLGMEQNMNFFRDVFHCLGARKLEMKRIIWPQAWGLPLWDFELQAFTDVEIVCARGTGFTQQVALRKTLGEMTERLTLHSQKSNMESNGVAVHTDLSSAKRLAAFELIERDLFLCHFLTLSPFRSIPAITHIPTWMNAESLIGALRNVGVELKTGLMGIGDGWAACCVGAFGGKRFGVITASACAENVEVAISKAGIECLRNVAYEIYGNSDSRPMDIEAFLGVGSPGPKDHYLLGLNDDSARHMLKLFDSKVKGPRMERAIPSEFFWQVLAEYGSGNRGLYVVRAINPELQDMFFGSLDARQVNLNRMKQFTGNSEISIAELNVLPHTHH